MIVSELGHTIIKSRFFQSIFPRLSYFSDYYPVGNSRRLYLTVDVEAGYLDNFNQRHWMRDNSLVYQGYLSGLSHLLTVFQQQQVSATLFICPQCFSAPKPIRRQIIDLISTAYHSGHQIGLHFHPREDIVLHQYVGKKLDFTSSKFYSSKDITQFLKAERQILKTYLGSQIADNIIAFRWGNFASDRRVFKVLSRCGFTLDSSVSPLLSGHFQDDRYYDWSTITSNRSYLSSNVKEVPITTFKIFGFPIRAEVFWGGLIFIPLSRGGQINLLVHSCECNDVNGRPTYVLKHLSKIIDYAKKNNYQFCHLQ